MVDRPFHAVLANFRRMGAKIPCNKKFCSVPARLLGKLRLSRLNVGQYMD